MFGDAGASLKRALKSPMDWTCFHGTTVYLGLWSCTVLTSVAIRHIFLNVVKMAPSILYFRSWGRDGCFHSGTAAADTSWHGGGCGRWSWC